MPTAPQRRAARRRGVRRPADGRLANRARTRGPDGKLAFPGAPRPVIPNSSKDSARLGGRTGRRHPRSGPALDRATGDRHRGGTIDRGTEPSPGGSRGGQGGRCRSVSTHGTAALGCSGRSQCTGAISRSGPGWRLPARRHADGAGRLGATAVAETALPSSRPDVYSFRGPTAEGSLVLRRRSGGLHAHCEGETEIRGAVVHNTFRLELRPSGDVGRELLFATSAPLSGMWTLKTLRGVGEVQAIVPAPVETVAPYLAALAVKEPWLVAAALAAAQTNAGRWWR